LAPVKPHDGFVGLRNSFDRVWTLLHEVGDLSLKTQKRKTHFVVRAMIVAHECSDKDRAIVFLRRVHMLGRLEQAAICFECCWGSYYACDLAKIGMYCKALDKWASSF
jgi:hypothetical protein